MGHAGTPLEEGRKGEVEASEMTEHGGKQERQASWRVCVEIPW